ncbi:MAG: glycerophosphodiester phosphodiesterase [Sphaerochaetaceae bacterium]|nr:glycerophosphodiester phosphodiesterase [Sphaerochaetaceae bacterium]
MINEGFLNPMPRVVAHRGDSKHFPENTIEAFLSAVKMGVDVIETDVHLSKDNVVVIWHDETLDRNTNGSGRIEDHVVDELIEFDAGYTFSKDGGKTFPFRNKGVKLCTLEEALTKCPNQRFNVDLKTKDLKIVDEFIKVVRAHNAEDRVCCASFHLENLLAIRKAAPDILTSVTTKEVLPLLLKQKLGILPKKLATRRIIFQVPVAQGIIKVITPRFVKMMHIRDAIIMVWTINDENEMIRLFKMGVDSIMTDDPKTVIKVANELNLR